MKTDVVRNGKNEWVTERDETYTETILLKLDEYIHRKIKRTVFSWHFIANFCSDSRK